ncbi:MAG: hypothetical protein IPI59_14310 [Sphingobacteriales bacterium]|jgi:hypothetical protein|nr:hypothetical protein [Sphingobacteriales bacterium]MBP9141107.1 hypothetical protein [Chitinophagales bacterium]MDA0197711.1 hypothetical protein [Bacteroidota bacterium]MBK6888809.1 hypothetical protein [Sphingobacteriales bacterium]MBK7528684.1 hypothetical protein [Sphingobacteriales bacterium]
MKKSLANNTSNFVKHLIYLILFSFCLPLFSQKPNTTVGFVGKAYRINFDQVNAVLNQYGYPSLDNSVANFEVCLTLGAGNPLSLNIGAGYTIGSAKNSSVSTKQTQLNGLSFFAGPQYNYQLPKKFLLSPALHFGFLTNHNLLLLPYADKLQVKDVFLPDSLQNKTYLFKGKGSYLELALTVQKHLNILKLQYGFYLTGGLRFLSTYTWANSNNALVDLPKPKAINPFLGFGFNIGAVRNTVK